MSKNLDPNLIDSPVAASCDTVGLFIGADMLPALPPGIEADLREANGQPFIKRESRYRDDPKKGLIGLTYEINQPTNGALQVFDEIQAACDGRLSRFDIAVDFLRNPYAMKRRLLRQAIIIRRSAAYPLMNDHKNTTYWQNTTDREMAGMKPPRRNLALYSDRTYRLSDDKLPCTHFELRISDPDAVRRELKVQGLGHKPSDLLRLNPADLFARNVALLDISEDDIERWIQQQSSPHRMRGQLDRFHPHRRAQELHLIYGIKGTYLPIDDLGIPNALTVRVVEQTTVSAPTSKMTQKQPSSRTPDTNPQTHATPHQPIPLRRSRHGDDGRSGSSVHRVRIGRLPRSRPFDIRPGA